MKLSNLSMGSKTKEKAIIKNLKILSFRIMFLNFKDIKGISETSNTDEKIINPIMMKFISTTNTFLKKTKNRLVRKKAFIGVGTPINPSVCL